MFLWKLDVHMEKNKSGLLYYTTQKISLKCINDFNIEAETVQLLEEQRTKAFWYSFVTDFFFFLTARKYRLTKREMNKLKSFFTAKKKNNTKKQQQPMEWDNMFSNCLSDKGLIFKIYETLIQLISRNNPNNPIFFFKWAKKLEILCQNIYKNGQQVHEKMPNIIIRVTNIKTRVWYHLIYVRMALIKNSRDKYWWSCG